MQEDVDSLALFKTDSFPLPQIRKLIQEHHIGSILLTAKNLKCTDMTRLTMYLIVADVEQLPNKPRSWSLNYRGVPMMQDTRSLSPSD